MTPTKASPDRSPLARRAFSLIELLVVITIIAVVIAITVPALSGARELARKSATESSVNSLVQAAAQFRTDEQRAPGFFSPEEMGDPDNVNRGLSSMQNIMLELIGGVVEEDPANTSQLEVGPRSGNGNTVFVDPALINVDKAKSYYTPNADDYKPAQGTEASEDNHKELPEVHDAWGMPILAWVENDIGSVMNDNSVLSDFAQNETGEASDPARYYWAQNSAALRSAALGQRQTDQDTGSLVGSGVAASDRAVHMAALLGSPNSSVNGSANYRQILPRVGRGPVLFHSAGSDRVFVSSKDNGYNRLAGEFLFGRNLTPGDTVVRDPYPEGSIDILDAFDDIVTAAGS